MTIVTNQNEDSPLPGPVSPEADIGSMNLAELLGVWRSRVAEVWQEEPGLYIMTAEQMLKLGEPLMAYDVLTEGLKFSSTNIRLRQLQALALLRTGVADGAEVILMKLEEEGNRDEETIGLLARIHKERWERRKINPDLAARELSLAHDYYRKAYEANDGYWSGINAATTALLSGQRDAAIALARKVRDQCRLKLDRSDGGRNDYWLLATLAEAALILEEWDEAALQYRAAAAMGRRKFGDLSSTRRNASLILNHFGKTTTGIEDILRVPPIVVFSGHMIDRPDRPAPRFPPELEGPVRHAIRERLIKIDPALGFASAANGSDILFLETMLELGAEVHVVLPYNQEQFLKDSVEIAPGSNWTARFEKILEKATQILTASDQPLGGGGVSYEYANLMLYGLAATRARQLGTDMVPLTVWDGRKGGEGGTGENVKRWHSDGLQIEVIDLRQILEAAGLDSRSAVRAFSEDEVKAPVSDLVPHIRSLLFADALHFSRLSEAQIPVFFEQFLGTIAKLLARTAHKPMMRNTWGDGLFMVFDRIEEAGAFALELCDVINETKWEEKSLPAELNLRIALHAGPVFECIDPISESRNFFGTHVNRAARIEPITPPGHVYASEGFAALAAAQGKQTFVCDYVGQVPQAKGYGTFPTYHVHRRG
jgi:class 3 adenylate cyclase